MALNDILKELQFITRRGYSPWNVFDDWLSLMVYALMRNDEEYLKIVGRYKNDREQGDREIDHFKDALDLRMKYMSETNEEALGYLYEQWDIINGK